MTRATEQLARVLLKSAQGSHGLAPFPAFMGDSSGTISTGVAGYVYVRLYNGEVMEVFNNRVPNAPGWVMVGVDPLMPGLLQVLGPRDVFPEMPSSSGVGEHHETHELFNGHDVTWIHNMQILDKLAKPSEVSGEEFIVQIYSGEITTASGFAKVLYQKVDVSASLPTAGARYVLLQSDAAGVVTAKNGSLVDAKELLTRADIPAADADHYPLWAVALYDGQERLRCDATFNDFVDLRYSGFSLAGGGGFDLAAEIHAATPKITIAALDEFGIADSADAYGLKSVTWETLLANVVDAANLLYDPLGAAAAAIVAHVAELDPHTQYALDSALSGYQPLDADLTSIANAGLPLPASLGGLGIANGASASLGLPNLAISFAGGVAAGVYTLPATSQTLAGLAVAGQTFTRGQFIDGSADEIQLRVQRLVGQGSYIQTWENESGVALARIDRDGNISGQSAWGSLSANMYFVTQAGTGQIQFRQGSNILVYLYSNYTAFLEIAKSTQGFLLTGMSASIPTMVVNAYTNQTTAVFRVANVAGTVQNELFSAHATNVYTNVFNEQGSPNLDFRVESDAYDAIFVDASNDSVNLGGNALAKVSVYDATALARQTHIADATDAASAITQLNLLLAAVENFGILKTA